MLSFTSLGTLFGNLTNNSSTANLALGSTLINQATRLILGSKSWPFLFKTNTFTTTASTQFYNLFPDFNRLLTVTITVGTTVYQPKEAPSREFWEELNRSGTFTSSYPEYFYIFNKQIGFWPTPSTSAYTVTCSYERGQKDLSVADYTTGTIVSIANGATAVTGSGTTFTASMVGRMIRIAETNAALGGDGVWYEIGTYTSATLIGLTLAYAGTSIAAGAATYTIGQVSALPEERQHIPVYRAAQIYFTSIQPNVASAALYKNMYDEELQIMKSQEMGLTTNPVIEEGYRVMLNPNNYPTGLA